jgi:biopolymer transport protein ExbD
MSNLSRHRAEDKPTEVTLPITPMLDMAFQLMFFFLATFNPISQKEGQMDLSLPAKSDPAAKKPEDVKPTSEAHKEEVDDKADLTITIRGYQDQKNKGQISALAITTTAGTKTLQGTEEGREENLRKELAEAKPKDAKDKDGKPKIPTVRMEAEKDLRWSQVVRIMDICYKAGFQVSFAKPPDVGGQ